MSQFYFENFLVFYFHVLIEDGITTVAPCRPYLPECNYLTHLYERFQV
jgi:hypothetical protein